MLSPQHRSLSFVMTIFFPVCGCDYHMDRNGHRGVHSGMQTPGIKNSLPGRVHAEISPFQAVFLIDLETKTKFASNLIRGMIFQNIYTAPK